MRQERKKTKKRNKRKGRRTIRGGKPKFIKTIAYYTDEDKPMLVDYKIIHSNMNKDEQKKYAEKHKVYYPVETPSIIDEIFGSIDPHKIRLMTERFFTPHDNPKTVFKEDGETIVIHDGEDIEKIKITNKMLMNHYVSNKLMENLKNLNKIKRGKSSGGAPSDNETINKYKSSVNQYKKYINDTNNKDILFYGLSDKEKEVAENLLKTPVFFNIISKKLGFEEIPMNYAKIIMENSSLPDADLLKKIGDHSSEPESLGPELSDSEALGPEVLLVSKAPSPEVLVPEAPKKLLKEQEVIDINKLLGPDISVDDSGNIMDDKTKEAITLDPEKIKEVNSLLIKNGYIVNDNKIQKQGLSSRTLDAAKDIWKKTRKTVGDAKNKLTKKDTVRIYPSDPSITQTKGRKFIDMFKKNKVGIDTGSSATAPGSSPPGSDSSAAEPIPVSGTTSLEDKKKLRKAKKIEESKKVISNINLGENIDLQSKLLDMTKKY